MRNRFLRQGAFLLGVIMLVSLCVIDAGAQSRRKRRTRRTTKPAAAKPVVTNPTIAPPGSEEAAGTDGERIISTADQSATETEAAAEATPAKKNSTPTKAGSDAEMQKTINQLSNQVDRLNDKLTRMQENDRALIDMERLTRAEQRAESLRAQQVDVESKLADLQAKVDQIDYLLRPENIERAAGYGTVHPEEARDTRRRQLESEKSRVIAQVKILETSRTRLETSVVTADAEVDNLRRRIESQQLQQQSTSGSTTAEPQPRRPKPE
jgi:DNA repair exonuclease SbcCD ATPase subunit